MTMQDDETAYVDATFAAVRALGFARTRTVHARALVEYLGRRVEEGATLHALSAEIGVPVSTIGYWLRTRFGTRRAGRRKGGL